ncbi:hypothetical protein B0H13DRAFT_1859329 [Mycena leptocephala]|nr:hypothetical protein B0H13DRAFT_1859329 [Mycena leptocephala]
MYMLDTRGGYTRHDLHEDERARHIPSKGGTSGSMWRVRLTGVAVLGCTALRPSSWKARRHVSLFFSSFYSYHQHHPTTDGSNERVKMPVAGADGSQHTAADRQFLDSVSARQLMEFRDYSAVYIKSHPDKFLDHGWVDISLLREYLASTAPNASSDASSTRSFPPSDPVRVKIEAPLPSASNTSISVKWTPTPVYPNFGSGQDAYFEGGRPRGLRHSLGIRA